MKTNSNQNNPFNRIFIGFVATLLGFAVFIGDESVSAQGNGGKVKPRTAKSYADTQTKTVASQAIGSIDSPRWVLLINVWFDYEGMNISSLDRRSPLLNLNDRADFRGRKYFLEPGDVISRINGIPIGSYEDYQFAIQNAANPRLLRFEVINSRNGEVLTLWGRAVKVR